MIDLPREPNPGEDLDSSWGVRVVRAIRALFPIGGPGIHVATGPTGTTISAAGSASAASAAAAPDVVPAVVTSGSGGVYRVDLYANGLLSPRTGQGRLAVPEVSMLQTLEAGSVVLAHLVTVEVLDHGMESSDWAEEGDGEE